MSGNLLVIIPSRGRPERLSEAIREGQRLARGDTDYVIALDDDDPALGEYRSDALGIMQKSGVHQGLRKSLTGWTNLVARFWLDDYDYMASFGDDHIPRTEGWDVKLVDAIGGTGFSYPNDLRRADIPEAVVVSTNVIRALGWFACPQMDHFWIDNAWADLGRGMGRLAYCPDVIVEHAHYLRSASVAHDATYAQAESRMHLDEAGYRAWCAAQRDADIEKLKGLL